MKLFQMNGPIIKRSDNYNTENIGAVVISRELGVYDKHNSISFLYADCYELSLLHTWLYQMNQLHSSRLHVSVLSETAKVL